MTKKILPLLEEDEPSGQLHSLKDVQGKIAQLAGRCHSCWDSESTSRFT